MTAVAVHAEVTGPPGSPFVVLLNSLGSTLRMWDPQMDALSERFRVVRHDTRGHGRSPVPAGPYVLDDLADDVVHLLDRIGVERAHLVGLSLGGMTALRLAARDPQRVVSVVALCTSARLEPTRAWHDRAVLVRAEGSAAVAEAVVRRWYTADFHDTHPAQVDQARAMVSATPAEGYAACCEAIADMDLRTDLVSIAAPVLAIAGAEDPATPPEHLQQIAAGVRCGSLAIVPRAAHLANAEQPAVVTNLIVNQLKALQRAAT
jgi:3-oxoadipate enol-lactonase